MLLWKGINVGDIILLIKRNETHLMFSLPARVVVSLGQSIAARIPISVADLWSSSLIVLLGKVYVIGIITSDFEEGRKANDDNL